MRKKTRKKARKSKRRTQRRTHVQHDHAPSGHHGRLRKRQSTPEHARKRSALMERLHAAADGARARLRSFGRRKHHNPEKLVTEQTLRDQLALKRIRRSGR